MRAIVCHELTGPASLRLEELAEPRPGPGQVRIGVRACGVNFADSLITRGQYQKQPQLPFSPGFEVSGEVLELAAGVEGVARGDRVLAMTPCGGYAEQVVADANRCLHQPIGANSFDPRLPDSKGIIAGGHGVCSANQRECRDG